MKNYKDKILKYNLCFNVIKICIYEMLLNLCQRGQKGSFNKRDNNYLRCIILWKKQSSKNDWSCIMSSSICEECFNSKERQEKFRLNIFFKNWLWYY